VGQPQSSAAGIARGGGLGHRCRRWRSLGEGAIAIGPHCVADCTMDPRGRSAPPLHRGVGSSPRRGPRAAFAAERHARSRARCHGDPPVAKAPYRWERSVILSRGAWLLSRAPQRLLRRAVGGQRKANQPAPVSRSGNPVALWVPPAHGGVRALHLTSEVVGGIQQRPRLLASWRAALALEPLGNQ
jgi:hypothetical protein